MAVSTSSSLIDLVTHDWKQINLPSLRSELDEKLLEFDGLSNENKLERKELSKQTKELKKCNNSEKLKKFGSVLKLYQKHIDSKDNECKFIFSSFLKIYKILSSAPDPIDALQNGQIEILKLQKCLLNYNEIKMRLKNYENEFNDLKNQEITVKKLKEEIKNLQNEQIDKINIELIKQQNQFENEYKIKLNEKDIKYNECELKLNELQNELIVLQQKLDEQQNKLLSESLSNEQNKDIEESTQNMLEEELDRANITILTLKKENNELLKTINNNNDSYINHNKQNQEMIDFEINTLKKRLFESKENCNKLQTENDKIQKEYKKLKEFNESNTKKLHENIEKMRRKLQNLPNEDEYILLKEKVTILQQEFLNNNNNKIATSPFNNDDVDDIDINIDIDIDNLPIDVSMDTLFNTKLQSLQSEINGLKLDLHSKNNELLTFTNNYNDIKQQYDEQKKLIIKLENDLTKYINPNNDDNDNNNNNNDDKIDDIDTNNINDPLYKILNITDNNDEEKKVKEESMVTMTINIDDKQENDENENDEYSVMALPTKINKKKKKKKRDKKQTKKEDNSAFLIICEQRDRFRIKAQKLEQNQMRMESKYDRLCLDNVQLKKENVELYTKIKFLENYNNVKKHHNLSPNKMLSKYDKLYEEQMNPFAIFRNKEKEKRINSLDWTEWIAFVVGSTVLSKRLFRLFTVFYAIALHLLIFFTILHEYRSHGVFGDNHSIHCPDQLPGVQIDIPSNHQPQIDNEHL